MSMNIERYRQLVAERDATRRAWLAALEADSELGRSGAPIEAVQESEDRSDAACGTHSAAQQALADAIREAGPGGSAFGVVLDGRIHLAFHDDGAGIYEDYHYVEVPAANLINLDVADRPN